MKQRTITAAIMASVAIALLAIGGVFDVGSLAAYLNYVKQVSQPINQISQQVNVLLASMAGAERIFAVMDAQPEIDEGKTILVRVEKKADVAYPRSYHDYNAVVDLSHIPAGVEIGFQTDAFGEISWNQLPDGEKWFTHA